MNEMSSHSQRSRVIWQVYSNSKLEWLTYPKELAYVIEEAYRQGVRFVRINEKRDVWVDFSRAPIFTQKAKNNDLYTRYVRRVQTPRKGNAARDKNDLCWKEGETSSKSSNKESRSDQDTEDFEEISDRSDADQQSKFFISQLIKRIHEINPNSHVEENFHLSLLDEVESVLNSGGSFIENTKNSEKDKEKRSGEETKSRGKDVSMGLNISGLSMFDSMIMRGNSHEILSQVCNRGKVVLLQGPMNLVNENSYICFVSQRGECQLSFVENGNVLVTKKAQKIKYYGESNLFIMKYKHPPRANKTMFQYFVNGRKDMKHKYAQQRYDEKQKQKDWKEDASMDCDVEGLKEHSKEHSADSGDSSEENVTTLETLKSQREGLTDSWRHRMRCADISHIKLHSIRCTTVRNIQSGIDELYRMYWNRKHINNLIELFLCLRIVYTQDGSIDADEPYLKELPSQLQIVHYFLNLFLSHEFRG